MDKKDTSLWKWVLTFYLIYIFIYIFLQFIGWDPGGTVYVTILLIGNALGIFSIYKFTRNNKVHLNRFLRLGLFSFYTLFTTLNTLVFSVGLIGNFWGYFADKAGFVIHISGLVFPLIALYPAAFVFTNLKLGKNIWRFFREAYLWLWTLLLVAIVIAMLFEIQKWTFYDYLTFLIMILSLLIMYSYFKKREFFSRSFWKIYFWFNLSWGILETIYWAGDLDQYFTLPDYLKSFNPPADIPLTPYLVMILLIVPAYYPLIKIAYDKHFFDKSS